MDTFQKLLTDLTFFFDILKLRRDDLSANPIAWRSKIEKYFLLTYVIAHEFDN